MQLKSIYVQGLGIIEVLVALAITSFGLLGLAGLLISAQQTAAQASQRATAIVLLQDMVARIHSNASDANLGLTSAYVTAKTPYTQKTNCLSASNNCCSYSDMAINDLYEWTNNVANFLPSGTGIVCVDTAPNENAATTACTPPTQNQSPVILTIKIQYTEQSGTKRQVITTVAP